MAEIYQLDVYQGVNDYRFEFEIRNKLQTVCLDIASWNLSWMVKRQKPDTDASALITKSISGGGISLGGAFNAVPGVNTQIATVSLDDTDTTGIAESRYYWELKRTDNGFETVLADGGLEITQGVHR